MKLPDGLVLPAAQWEALRAGYAHPPRHYHDFTHVGEVAAHFRAVADGPGWRQPREVFLAVLYHDVVYVVGRRDNEERSAQVAIEAIGRWLPDSDIDADRVAELIRLTATHGRVSGPLDDDAKHFLDCDMAILGASPERFTEYEAQIAAEYRAIYDAASFAAGRRAFLSGLAGKPVFHSAFFRDRYEAAAQRNLAGAMGPGPGGSP